MAAYFFQEDDAVCVRQQMDLMSHKDSYFGSQVAVDAAGERVDCDEWAIG
jgi:hypothetical protein